MSALLGMIWSVERLVLLAWLFGSALLFVGLTISEWRGER